MRLGAAAGGRLPVPNAASAEEVAAKENGAVAVGGIAALKKELAMLKAKNQQSEAKNQKSDETIAILRKQVGPFASDLVQGFRF